MTFLDIEKYLNIPKALTPSVESTIIRHIRLLENESPVNIPVFRLNILLRAVMSASNKTPLYYRENEYPVQNEYQCFSGSFFTALKLNTEKLKRTENEYFVQIESSVFFHSFLNRITRSVSFGGF
jgi:hypothetical protein